LADLYNLTFKDYSLIKDTEQDSLWDRYYERIKDLITSDIPVQTGVDPYKLKFWNERLNLSNETAGGHAVVIVGYNEINNTICFNDPYAAAMNISGMYIWEDQDSFKTAVEGMNGFYKIFVFYKQNQLEKPTRKERFEKVHDINIQRLKGEFKYYFGVDIDPSDLPFIYRLYFNLCYNLGVDAAKQQKIDIHGPLQRLITLYLYKQYETIISPYYAYYDVFQQIENVSKYLLEQQNLSSICLNDGLLLNQESKLWKNLSIYFKEIQEINLNNSLIKTFLLTNAVFNEIEKTIDEIINIEKEIINNSQNFFCHKKLDFFSCATI
jgi:hypothetical protein